VGASKRADRESKSGVGIEEREDRDEQGDRYVTNEENEGKR
jgi:hypothetical protein